MISLINFENGNYLNLSEDQSIFLRVIGKGDPLIIVHGGPGLEHYYLYRWLLPLSEHRTLIFYDQCGCGRDLTPLSEISATKVVQQLYELVRALGISTDIGFFGHSWGSHVILTLLEKYPSIKSSELILCSPQGLTSDRSTKAIECLMERFPSAVMQIYEDILATGKETAGVDAMNTLLPYYLASQDNIPEIEFRGYTADVEKGVNESLGEYDLRDFASKLTTKTLIIYGDKDFETPNNTIELHKATTQLLVLANAGHFPFAEVPTFFQEKVSYFLKVTDAISCKSLPLRDG
jgi:proline iminopeptidase